MSAENEHSVKQKDGDTRGTVTLLSRHKASKQALPIVTVERINDSCRWQVEPGERCTESSYGLRCYSPADFVISTPGSKKAWIRCRRCLDDLLLEILERPAAEAAKIEAEEIESRIYQECKKAAEDEHARLGLCTGYSKNKPFSLCDQKPVAHCKCWRGERLCARHVVRCRKNHPEKLTHAA